MGCETALWLVQSGKEVTILEALDKLMAVSGPLCHANKDMLERLVTITHFDCPMHLIQTYGGWKNRRLIEFYKKLVTTLFTRYKGLVKYWITFNEINMILHLPFMGAGIQFEEGEDQKQTKYISARHELVASAWATKIAHGIDPENMMLTDMLAGAGINVYTSSKFAGCTDGKATIIDDKGKEHVVDAETIVQAVGFAPNDTLYNEINESLNVPVWNIGDSKEPGNVINR